ncbi:MAG: PEGA domain-containing protein [Candidatus Omnitrophica bacterium]|nr:PEGA domain-containing protein [Candidatus Omnitrophota bacterium]
MKILRRIVFYICLVIYLTLCPLTLLGAFGYHFQPGAEKGIVKTGLIVLSTHPPQASVFLGKRRFTEQTPTSLRDLLPGTYPVKLVRKGFRPWTAEVTVEAGKATVLSDILLLPLQWKQTRLSLRPWMDLIPLPMSPYFLLKEGSQLEKIHLFDRRDGEIRPLIDDSPWAQATILSLRAMENYPGLLTRVSYLNRRFFLSIRMERGIAEIQDLSAWLSEMPTRAYWEPQEERLFLLERNGLIRFLHFDEDRVFSRILPRMRALGWQERTPYLTARNGALYRLRSDGRLESFLEIVSKHRVMIHIAHGTFLSTGQGIPFSSWKERPIRGFAQSPRQEHLLIWQRKNIGIMEWPRTESSLSSSRNEKLEWIFTGGKHIRQAFFVNEGRQVLFLDGSQLRLLETTESVVSHAHPVIEVKPRTTVHYSEHTGQVYFLDPSTGFLTALQILPSSDAL